MYLTSLATLIALCCLVSLIGQRAADLLPDDLRGVARRYFAPVLGLAVLALVATLYGWMFPFSFWPIAVLTLAIGALCLWRERNPGELLRCCLLVCAVAAFGCHMLFLPLLLFGDYVPFVDTMTYLVHAQWLQQHPFSEPAAEIAFHPGLVEVTRYQSGGSRMAASFSLAFIQALFHFELSYHAYPAAVALPLACGALALGGGVRLMVPGRYPGHAAIPIITACTATILPSGFAFGASYGFLPMTQGLAFASAGVILFAALLNHETLRQDGQPLDYRRIATETAPVALLFTALTYAYNDLLGPLGLGLVIFVAIFALLRRAQLAAIAAVTVIAAIQTLVLAAPELTRIVSNIFVILSFAVEANQIGGEVPWSPFEFICHAFGFRSFLGQAWLFFSPAASKFLVAALLGFCIAAALLWRNDRRAVPLYASLCVLAGYALVFAYFRYVATPITPGEAGRTFLQFKLANYASPIASLWIGVTLALFARRFDRTPAFALGAIAMGTFMLFGLAHAYRLTAITAVELAHRETADLHSLIALRQAVARMPATDVIDLDLPPRSRQTAIYMLLERKVAGRLDALGRFSTPSTVPTLPLQSANWIVRLAAPEDHGKSDRSVIGDFVLMKGPAHPK